MSEIAISKELYTQTKPQGQRIKGTSPLGSTGGMAAAHHDLVLNAIGLNATINEDLGNLREVSLIKKPTDQKTSVGIRQRKTPLQISNSPSQHIKIGLKSLNSPQKQVASGTTLKNPFHLPQKNQQPSSLTCNKNGVIPEQSMGGNESSEFDATLNSQSEETMKLKATTFIRKQQLSPFTIVQGHHLQGPSSNSLMQDKMRTTNAVEETQTNFGASDFPYKLRDSAFDVSKGFSQDQGVETDDAPLFRNQILQSLQGSTNEDGLDYSPNQQLNHQDRKSLYEARKKLRIKGNSSMMSGYEGNVIQEENDLQRIGTVEKIKRRLQNIKNAMQLQPKSVYFKRSTSSNEKYESEQGQRKRLSVGGSVLSDHSGEAKLNSVKVIDPVEQNTNQMSQLKLNLSLNENNRKAFQLPNLTKAQNLLQSGIKGKEAIKSFILQPYKEENQFNQRMSQQSDNLDNPFPSMHSIGIGQTIDRENNYTQPSSPRILFSNMPSRRESVQESRSLILSQKHSSQYFNRSMMKSERLQKLRAQDMINNNAKPLEILNKGIQKRVERKMLEQLAQENSQAKIIQRQRNQSKLESEKKDPGKEGGLAIQSPSNLKSTFENINSAIQSQSSTPQAMMQPTLGFQFTQKQQLIKFKPSPIVVNFATGLGPEPPKSPPLPSVQMIKNAIINTAGVKHSPKRQGPFQHQRAKSHMSNYDKLPSIAVGSGSFAPLVTKNNFNPADSSYGNPLNNIQNMTLHKQNSQESFMNKSMQQQQHVIMQPVVKIDQSITTPQFIVQKPKQITFVDVSINSKGSTKKFSLQSSYQ